MKRTLYPLLILIVIASFTSADKKPATVIHPLDSALTKWTVDKANSAVSFSVSHMVVADAKGYFKLFDGSMEHTKPDFSDAKINFTVDVNSIDTDSENRDAHLKSDDFFDVTTYPLMRFESISFKPAKGKNYKLTGNLTIREVTKQVMFDVVYNGTTTSTEARRSSFKATTTINRFDYNLKWNKATETGGFVVGKEVKILVLAEFNEVQ